MSVAVVDLHALTDEDWAQIRIPDGWHPIANACRKMGAGLPAFCVRVAREVSETIPEPEMPDETPSTGFPGSGSDRRQLMAYSLIRPAIFGLAENRGPLASETDIAAFIGRAVAQFGAPPDDIIRAFQIAFRAFLSEFSSFVDKNHGERLVESVSTLWIWLQEMSDAAARGYRDEATRLAALSVDARERFFGTIQRGDVSSGTAYQLARSLGFEVGGTFRAFWLKVAIEQTRLHAVVHGLPGITQAVVRGTDVMIISQGVPADRLEAALHGLSPDAAMGVGLEREHLDGARLSLVDAAWAVDVSALAGRPVRFEEDWLLATLHAQLDHLAVLMERGVRTARKHRHLAEAVSAFAANGFSRSAAARELHLRPNSLGYRLQRWSDHVGRSALTPDGLVYALLASLASTTDAAGKPGIELV